MWTYRQSTGELLHNSEHVGFGYSGAGAGKNNPVMQAVPDVGPIPQGSWVIVGPPSDTVAHGPYVIRLQPGRTTNTYARTGFLIHGDSPQHPGSASKGCIILPRAIREQLCTSADHELVVKE